MTNKELLELAAKATRIEYTGDGYVRAKLSHAAGHYENYPWNPLTDDGDAIRLAVKLGIDIKFDPAAQIVSAWCEAINEHICESYRIGERLSATRLVIVSAAAEIGKGVA